MPKSKEAVKHSLWLVSLMAARKKRSTVPSSCKENEEPDDDFKPPRKKRFKSPKKDADMEVIVKGFAPEKHSMGRQGL